MSHYKQVHGRRDNVVAVLTLIIGVAMFVAGAAIVGWIWSEDAAYDTLADTVTLSDALLSLDEASDDEEDGEATIDWDYLLSINGDVAAWLTVEGTSIDLPVVQAADEDAQEYYLHHNLWGDYSSSGTLFLDCRATANGAHALVYGHHLGWTSQMFSELFQAYKQEVFDTVGEATWSTPEGGTTIFTPVMAMTVDKTYSGIQSFEFADEEELREWLAELSDDASAVSSDLDGLLDGATRVLTLVTCSSTIGGQSARTLVIFVA